MPIALRDQREWLTDIVRAVKPDEWFSLWMTLAQVLGGGVVTVGAVGLTLRHSRKRQNEERIAQDARDTADRTRSETRRAADRLRPWATVILSAIEPLWNGNICRTAIAEAPKTGGARLAEEARAKLMDYQRIAIPLEDSFEGSIAQDSITLCSKQMAEFNAHVHHYGVPLPDGAGALFSLGARLVDVHLEVMTELARLERVAAGLPPLGASVAEVNL